jgi:hypothetical protein
MNKRFGASIGTNGVCVLAVLSLLLVLGSCSSGKPLKPVADREVAGEPGFAETGSGWFEFRVNGLSPVQDGGAFNSFLFPNIDPNTELLYAEGFVTDPPSAAGHKIPGITHRAGFDTYGESVDVLVKNPLSQDEPYAVWITTNDLRAPGFAGIVRVYYTVRN